MRIEKEPYEGRGSVSKEVPLSWGAAFEVLTEQVLLLLLMESMLDMKCP